MKTNYVLVDFENVQPTDLGLLKNGPFRVKLFLGPNQAKVPVAIAAALQALGGNAEYIILEKSGANALDFHIAYYIGALSAEEPTAVYNIISRDTGFDPLIKHLKHKAIAVHRSARIADMPCFKRDAPEANGSQLDKTIEFLVGRKGAVPKTQKSLLRSLHAHFKKEMNEEQLTFLFDTLCERGIVTVDGAKVSYALPQED
ncbi:MAG: hypothetical protein HYV27_00785 [Candidatus Hydrogenedentes bacterium]|nr:hypothetical protein [Candidatus Hydrogenedentota bacterium]